MHPLNIRPMSPMESLLYLVFAMSSPKWSPAWGIVIKSIFNVY